MFSVALDKDGKAVAAGWSAISDKPAGGSIKTMEKPDKDYFTEIEIAQRIQAQSQMTLGQLIDLLKAKGII